MDNPLQIFIEETLTRITKIRQAISTLKEEPHNKTCQNILHIFFHTVYGTGAAVGFGEIIEAAKSLEDRIATNLETGQAADINLLKECEDTVDIIEERANLLKTVEDIISPDEQEQKLPEVPRKEVLIVDDDTAIRQFIKQELSKKNLGIVDAGDASEAKKILEHYRPDLIILDIVMPGTNGLELFKELRTDHRYKWTPIFFLTSKSSPMEIVEGIKLGADDYIIKPFNTEDLVARIEAKISRMEELHGLAVRDPLTGTFSRGYFMERLTEEVERFSRHKKSFCVAICDLDFFKKVNDEHGHQVGDFVLQQFASFLYSKFRRTDTIGRYGGEEFVALLPDTDALTAYKILERLRSAWEKMPIIEPYQNKNIQITFSSGIGEFDKDGKTEQEIIKAADAALYLAKETGRNKVVLAGQSGKGVHSPLTKILVVDDSAVIRNILLKELEEDYMVFMAKDGEDALEQLQRIRPHLAIIDLIMPIIGGLELIKKIRENPNNSHIKIIAFNDESVQTETRTFGYLSKDEIIALKNMYPNFQLKELYLSNFSINDYHDFFEWDEDNTLRSFYAEKCFFDGNSDFSDTKYGMDGFSLASCFFGNGKVDFQKTIFMSDTVHFNNITFGTGEKDFTSSCFYSKNVNFFGTQFGDGKVLFRGSNLNNSYLNFSAALFGKGDIEFDFSVFGAEGVDFSGVNFGDGEVSFRNANFRNIWLRKIQHE
ncbi:diguanylate cyclase [Pelotomaculum isophthalicicum JI]|uniref:Stage 0 sporulation protein A homolog n=1 Tax=Pelotomaculum isophthalicicum JI TaxID=947010 RepID=A0A9X4JTX7_9FIRM|nr:diguanylate cyclase [Pelotomaculum isophthalicicum]MDF9408125.1 diguanylate cyclase [Pelotomaculum isophthalicicum JI]